MELNMMTITKNGETDITMCFILCTRSERLADMLQTKQAYKIGNVSINATLSRVRATVVAVEKQ
jgi:hypothetical protein